MFIELHVFYSRVNREIKVKHLLLTGTYRRTAMNEDVNEVNHQSLSIEEKKLVNLVSIHTYTCLIEDEDS